MPLIGLNIVLSVAATQVGYLFFNANHKMLWLRLNVKYAAKSLS
jgi:hypothetical protein